MIKGIFKSYIIILAFMSILSVNISNAGWRDFITTKSLAITTGIMVLGATVCGIKLKNISQEKSNTRKSLFSVGRFGDAMFSRLCFDHWERRDNKYKLYSYGFSLLCTLALVTTSGVLTIYFHDQKIPSFLKQEMNGHPLG